MLNYADLGEMLDIVLLEDRLGRYLSEGPLADTSEEDEVKEVDVGVKVNDLGRGDHGMEVKRRGG